MKIFVLILVFASALFAGSAGASPDPASAVPTDPALVTGKLDNGLTYYIRRNASPAHRLELRLVVKAGSVLEDEDQQGLAHFVEHMAFNGSTHFKRQELVSFLQSIGVQFGADLNAYTSFDETVYTLSLPTGQRQHMETAFTVLEDWAHGVRFDDADIEKERAILLEEMNLRGGAAERIERQLRPRLFNGAKYAERLPIGKADILRHAPPEAIRRFYRDWYRPNLMAVVVVGDIAPGEAERLIKAHFAALANPVPARPRDEVAIPLNEKPGALVAVDPEAGGNTLSLRYAVEPAPRRGSVGVFRERMLQGMLSELLTDRLGDIARSPDAPFSWASVGIAYVNPYYRFFFMDAGLNERGPATALPALSRAAIQARQYGFSAAEFERVRQRRMRGYENMFNERAGVHSIDYAGEYVRNFIGGETLPSRETEYQLASSLLAEISLDDVNAAARSVIPADGARLVLYRGIDSPSRPSGDQLLAALEGAWHAPVDAWADQGKALQLMAMMPAPGRVVSRTRDAALDLTRLVLSNGVQVVLKPTGLQRDQVLLGATRDGGLVQFAPQDLPCARYADFMAGAMGAGMLSPAELRRSLAGIEFSLGTNTNIYTDTIDGWSGANRRDIETMLQVLWLRFMQVRRDPALFQTFAQNEAIRLTNAENLPVNQVDHAVIDGLFGKQDYAPHVLAPADIKAVDLDCSLRLYRQRFASAAGFTFILVGSFDVDTIIPLLETYLGSLPAGPRAPPPRDVGVRPARGIIRREVHAGDQGGFRLDFVGEAEFSEAEDLRLSALADIMNLRIIEVLRSRLGLVYQGEVSYSLNRLPYPEYSLTVTLPTTPEHLPQVRAAIFAEIERMQRDGPTIEELEKVRLAWLENYRKSMQDNGYWLNHLREKLFDGIDPRHILQFEEQARALTPEQVRETARRRFDLANYLELTLIPATKSASESASNSAAR